MASTSVQPVPADTLAEWGRRLRDQSTPLVEKFRCLFGLRHAAEPEAVGLIVGALDDKSALLRHEACYVLGQKGDRLALPALRSALADESQPPIVRHEAAEAIGAIGDVEDLELLGKFADSPVREIADTCQLAIGRIRWLSETSESERLLARRSRAHQSVDPAPPADAADASSVPELRRLLLDASRPMFDRYRAMFALRDLAGAAPEAAVAALSDALASPDSALLRHEVAFVLGQLADPLASRALTRRLAESGESGMVRHECAEALGAIGTDACVAELKRFLHDPEVLVRESCVLALDIADYVNGDQFQYATVPEAAAAIE